MFGGSDRVCQIGESPTLAIGAEATRLRAAVYALSDVDLEKGLTRIAALLQ